MGTELTRDREDIPDVAPAQLNECILAVDAAHTITYCSAPMVETFGIDVRDAIGGPLDALAATPHGVRIVDRLRQCLKGERTSGTLVVESSQAVLTYNYSCTPIPDARGQVTHGLLILFDDSIGQKAALDLDISEGRYNALVRGAMDAIISINDKGIIVQVNPASELLFGYPAGEMLSQPIEMLLPADERKRHRKLVEGFSRSSDSSRGMANFREVQGITKSGDTLYLEVAISKYGGPQPGIMTAIIRDVTKRHHMESQLRHFDKMRAIGQLAGGIAHDFNNVIAVIQGAAELAIEATSHNPQMDRYLKRILAASRLSKDLTSKLLLFARDEPLQRQQVEMQALFTGLKEMLERIFPANLTTTIDVEAGCWSVMTDISQLQNALINLSVNARDAMPMGGRLALSARNRPMLRFIDMNQATQQADMVEIAVSDSGVGMTQEVRNRAMEPFFTTKPRGEGNGLGLATVYGVVRRADGVIEIDSVSGQGTTVRILLPKGRNVEPLERAPRTGRKSNSMRNILLVEDNEPLRETQAEQLRNRGMIVFTASTAEEAREIFEREAKVDLLLTDFRLTDQSTGLDLALELRKLNPILPVLILTGYLEVAETTKLPEDIVMLIKPVPIEDLIDHVARVTASQA